MMLSHFTFMVTMNLMSRPHYYVRGRSIILLTLEVPKNYSHKTLKLRLTLYISSLES